MDNYVIILVILGVAILGMAWMPDISHRLRISYSIFYVLFGILLYCVLDTLPTPLPLVYPEFTLRVTELVVIVSLMGTGLKIDEPFSLKSWRIPFRLVSVTMLLSILIVSCLSHYFLQWDWASSILLGAVLAPTDPVLASDVQVGPPLEKSKNDVRFSLTAEAGLNDGMAFPFTWLAITVSLLASEQSMLTHWFLFDLLYRILAGAIVGFGVGKLLAYLIFYLPEKNRFVVTRDGFVAVSATLFVYGITELIYGYGFIAVFVTAITLRNYELGHEYHIKLHAFADQTERILMAIVLILFGGSIAKGIMDDLTVTQVILGLSIVLLVRPLTAMVSVFNTPLHLKEKAAISFFGIKGIGSFFYLSFALTRVNFPVADQLWSLTSFVVLASIVIHGISSTVVMGKIERQFSKNINENPKNEL